MVVLGISEHGMAGGTGREELILLGRILWALVLTLLVLAYVTVALRLWVRFRITKSPGWDDAAIVATLFVQLSEVFYILTTTTLKISLGLFFLRVLTKRWQIMLFHVILGVSAIYGFLYVLTAIFACGNPTNMADAVLGSKKCLPAALVLISGYCYGVINIIADWTFVLIPITVLLDSELDRRSKMSVSIVMALGAIGSVSSIMRIIFLRGLILISTGLSPVTVKATIWAVAEPGTGIVAASVAILRPLIRDIKTSVKTHASPIGSRKRSNADSEDTIALTSWASRKNGVSGTGEPWSPTTVYGKASVQRVVSIQGGRAR
ncbi:hypothetical protein ACEQ8H_006420 [Pleosporales sp. CAS-2024a]